jgi:hypothetical protein
LLEGTEDESIIEGTEDEFKIDNILNTDENKYHCSKMGTKFNISLRMKDESEFRLSHLSFKAFPN